MARNWYKSYLTKFHQSWAWHICPRCGSIRVGLPFYPQINLLVCWSCGYKGRSRNFKEPKVRKFIRKRKRTWKGYVK